MAFMYNLDVPKSVHPNGELEVQMDLSKGVIANLYEFNKEDFPDDEEEEDTFDEALQEKKPIYTLQQDEQTKQWSLITGGPISENDLREISQSLTSNLERWEKSDW